MLYGFIKYIHNNDTLNNNDDKLNFQVDKIVINEEIYELDMNTDLYLMVGVDKTGYAVESKYYLTGGQADVIFVVAVNDKKQEISILQLDRDTITEVRTFGIYGEPADTISTQIALAYAYGNGGRGSLNNIITATTRLLNIPITNCISATMSSIEKMVNALGGIYVTIPNDCTWLDNTYTKGARVFLEGTMAIRFITGRQETIVGTNADRMERHRAFIPEALKSLSILTKEDIDSFDDMYEEINPYLVSTMSKLDLYNL